MQQTKTIPAAVWIACLTIAAYALAQATVVIINRNFDAASRNAAIVDQNRSEYRAQPLPRLNTPEGSRSANVQKAHVGNIKVEQVSDTEWVLDRTSLLANTRDVNRFLNQARAVPYLKQGKTLGFQITMISRGSLYEKIGFRNGDVLLQVNRQKLNDPAKVASLYQEMRNKRHISILLSRNGQQQTFNYDIR